MTRSNQKKLFMVLIVAVGLFCFLTDVFNPLTPDPIANLSSIEYGALLISAICLAFAVSYLQQFSAYQIGEICPAINSLIIHAVARPVLPLLI